MIYTRNTFFRTFVLLVSSVLSAPQAFAAAHTSVSSSMDPMEMLDSLDPRQREAVLDALAGSSQTETNAALEFPELVAPLGTDPNAPPAEQQPQQIYDIDGQPIRDPDGQPLLLTDDLLQLLDTQTPEDWYDSDTPFLQQDILLKPFGYDLFAGVPTTFAPATDIPVPADYKLGPGDTLEIQLFGKENRQYSLVVTREGIINFPNIGPVNVMGVPYQEMKQAILDQVAEQLIGTSASVTMGPLRSIRVFVLGDARRPGSYTVSGLSTITNALFVSGGVTKIGSLRNVQLKRSGRTIATLDLYDLLINGDTGDDIRLESGDVIFVPPIGKTVSAGGFVRRPAIYELKNEKTVGEIIKLAGGLRPSAFPQSARIERIDDSKTRSFRNIDLTDADELLTPLQAGDVLLIPPVRKEFDNGVQLLGHVLRPGAYEWRESMRLTDLLPDMDKLRPQADLNYVLVRRQTDPDKRIQALSANLAVALQNPNSQENIELRPLDQITVFDLSEDRSADVADLITELSLQAGPDAPLEIVTIAGQVRAPGDYPFEKGMTVSDLVHAAAGFAESAYTLEAELSRRVIVDGNRQTTTLMTVDPEAAIDGEPGADRLLQPRDGLVIQRKQNWRPQLSVSLEGEVLYPGRYSFKLGDTLASVIERAGGLTERAFPEGSIFLREELRVREQQQLESLRTRLESDLAQLAVQAAGSVDGGPSVLDAQAAGSAILASLTRADAPGRLVIDLPAMLSNQESSTLQVILQDGDELLVPDQSQEVTVIGEVQFPTSHLFIEGLNQKDYISRSGGSTPNAAEKNIYVVKANGAVMANNSKWFRRRVTIEPGDTIVVPLDTQRGFRLQAWSNITNIIYNTAIAVAAINGLTN